MELSIKGDFLVLDSRDMWSDFDSWAASSDESCSDIRFILPDILLPEEELPVEVC